MILSVANAAASKVLFFAAETGKCLVVKLQAAENAINCSLGGWPSCEMPWLVLQNGNWIKFPFLPRNVTAVLHSGCEGHCLVLMLSPMRTSRVLGFGKRRATVALECCKRTSRVKFALYDRKLSETNVCHCTKFGTWPVKKKYSHQSS